MWRPGQWSTPTGNIPTSSPPPGALPLHQRDPFFNNRPYSLSPLPGGIGVGGRRPQLTPRASSLSLASSNNASTASLPASLRGQHNISGGGGVGKRAVSGGPPPAGIRHPLDVLEEILGAQVKPLIEEEEDMDGNGRSWEPEVEDAQGIDFGEGGLEEFLKVEEGREIQAREIKSRARAYSAHSVDEYEREKGKFQDLHRSIKACDEVLKSVESYLYSFQTDLGVVSAEIETLQNRSAMLNRRIENRRGVEKLLGPVVEDVALSPNVIKRIIGGDVNDSWVKSLQEVDVKMKAIAALDATKVKATQNVRPELERLEHKAIERVRDFFVARIKAIRVPGANAQVIQQSGFLRYKALFQFMANHHVQLADEIGQAYINTMRWYYLNHFTRYHKSLEKLKLHVMDKHDVVGQEEPVRRSMFPSHPRVKTPTNIIDNLIPSLKSSAPPSYDAFNIGRRIDTLKNRTAPILTANQAEEDRTPHYPEIPFRHFNAALVENASSEYSFITEFFSHKTYDQASTMFHQIFDPAFALGQTFTKSLIDSTLDCLGVLLCVRLNQYSAFEMQKRRIPAADAYINATNMLLWPRFQIIIDAHCESLRRATTSASSRGGVGGAGGGSSAKQQSTAPHFLTQRFAGFMNGILTLSAEAGDDEPVANSLGRLRSDFEAFLTKLSAAVTDAKKRERFLFNNYSLVLTIIGDTEGKMASEQRTHFEALKKAFGSGGG
ncbi:Vps52-domain-containing protein [Choiromyces venosus 120613-1]|uniref:Vps52-domain-containing protein n=1 Tax=Choiromyces venosus 120613-1 TaxID=1336337 RepID=A0A3N4K2R8_9PEZI|nr:Vps52-domain-containing protein [Choiromyces venosus 120613-1]